jgi:hypothetical protein
MNQLTFQVFLNLNNGEVQSTLAAIGSIDLSIAHGLYNNNAILKCYKHA